MKRLLILTIAAAFFFAACSGTDDSPQQNDNSSNNNNNQGQNDPVTFTVPSENHSLLVKFTGTNCPPCGGWGWTTFAELIGNTQDGAVHLSAYSSNPFAEHFINAESTALDDAQGITGYPTFSVNDIPRLAREGGSVNVNEEKKMCYAAVDAHAAAPVEMNAKIKYEIKDGKILITYKVKAFKDMPENNYFAIYILEHNVKQYQSGNTAGINAIHKHVLRKGVKGAWGINIGPMTNGQEITGKEEVTIGEDYSTGLAWNEENIEVLGIMRYELSSVQLFINACEGERLN